MLEHGYFVAAGDFYALTLAEKIGIGDSGGCPQWVPLTVIVRIPGAALA